MPNLQRLCIFLLLLSCCLAMSRPAGAQRILEGYVQDHRQQGISDAMISLEHRADSTVIIETRSGERGYFRLTTAALAGTLLQVSAPGYPTQWLWITDTAARPATLHLMLVREAQHLDNVTVSSRKPVMERRVDRTIYNVGNSAVSAGSDALEAVKRLPGVRVTNDAISLAGKSTVNVLVNDKLVQLSGDELVNLLKSIPADNLARIELITTPPAKYDAAGNSGLINLVLKKQLSNGLNGQVNLTYAQRIKSGGGGNTSFNYRHNKLNIYGTGNAYNSIMRPVEQVTSFYTSQRMEQHRASDNNSVYNRLQVGADYNLSARSVLGVQYTIGNGGGQYRGGENIRAGIFNTVTNALDSVINTRAATQDRGFRNVGNLNYEWKIDTSGRKLNVDLDYFHRTGKNLRDFTTQSFYESGAPAGDANTNVISGRQTVEVASAKADVAWPSKLAIFAFGGRISRANNRSNNLYEHLNGVLYEADPGKTNDFNYKETIGALYVSAQRSWKQWEAQLGFRGEYTQTKGYSPTLNQTNTNRYFKLFPTAYVQYNMDDAHSLNLTYSKRIDRPDFWVTNPFRSYTTANTYEEGNPFLQPSFSHTAELSYSIQSKYIFKVFAQDISNLHTRVSRSDSAQNVFYFTTANVGSVRNYGFTASATLNPFKWWEAILEVNGYYSVFRSGYYDAGAAVSYSRPGATLNTMNNFTLNKGKTLLAELNYVYVSTQLSDFDEQHGNSNLSAGVKMLLLNKKLTVGLNVSDLFRTDRSRLRNLYNGTFQDSYYDERTVRLNIGWKFGNSGLKAKRERATGSMDDNRTQ